MIVLRCALRAPYGRGSALRSQTRSNSYRLSWDSPYEEADAIANDNDPCRSTQLVRLVALKQYAAAERLRVQMEGTETPILPHKIYEQAAVNALMRGTSETRLAALRSWISLYPNLNEFSKGSNNQRSQPLRHIRNELFHAGAPASNMHIILPFSLLCAEKGYYRLISRNVLSLLPQSVPADAGKAFLLAWEQSRLAWDIEAGIQDAQHHILYRQDSVHNCCDCGWSDEALELCETAPPRFQLRKAIKIRLQDHFSSTGNHEKAARVARFSSPLVAAPRPAMPSADTPR